MALTKQDILNTQDIETKEITVLDTIPVWGGKTVYIRQLSRGEQDAYLNRQYGSAKMKQSAQNKEQEISSFSIYGHDAWLFARGVCDEDGKRIFENKDVEAIKEKSGEFVGWVATEILVHSRMEKDAKTAKDLGENKNDEGEGDVKN